MKKASNSSGGEYDCKQAWPDDCLVQCGGRGVVFTDGSSALDLLKNKEERLEAAKAVLGQESKKSHYVTSFFEAFPKEGGFIRGEGPSLEEAEQKAFEKYQKVSSCDHDYDRKGSESGWAECKKCLNRGIYLEPLTKCTQCNTPSYYAQDLEKKWYCEEHYHEMPISKLFASENNKSESQEEDIMYFYRHQAQIKVLKEFNFVVSSKPYKKMMDYLLQYSIRCEFSWKKDPTIRIEDIEGTLKDLIFIRSAVEKILIIFPELAQK